MGIFGIMKGCFQGSHGLICKFLSFPSQEPVEWGLRSEVSIYASIPLHKPHSPINALSPKPLVSCKRPEKYLTCQPPKTFHFQILCKCLYYRILRQQVLLGSGVEHRGAKKLLLLGSKGITTGSSTEVIW